MIDKKHCLLVAVLCIAVPALGQPLEPGDSDQDYDVDPYDIVLMQQAGKFGTGEPATWQEGDWDGGPGGEAGAPPAGDRKVTREDVDLAFATKNYLADPYAQAKERLGASDQILPGGATRDGQTSIVYRNDTGSITIDVPPNRVVSTILIESKSGIFNGDPSESVGVNDFDADRDHLIFKTIFGGGFSTFSLGAVAEKQHSAAFLLEDLSVSGAFLGGGGLGPVDLVYVGPPLPDVLPGDADQDYDVDAYDMVQVLQAGKFGTGEPATWDEGDWNAVGGPPGNPPVGDGVFDEVDLELMFEVGRYRREPYGPQETPRGQGARLFGGGQIGDDRVSVVYVEETGELALDVPPGVQLTSIVIDAGFPLFNGPPPENLEGPLDVADDDTLLAKISFEEGFSSLSFGRVAAPEENLSLVARSLRATGSRLGGGGLGLVDLVLFVESPGFRRGDANIDGRVDIADLAFLYHALTPTVNLGLLPCLGAADVNASTSVDVTDTFSLVRLLAGGSIVPVAPGPFECGRIPDSVFVRLTCQAYPASLCGDLPDREEDARFSFRFGDVPEAVGEGPDTTEIFEVVVQICNGLPLRAWSVGLVAEGDIEIVDVRTEGTLAGIGGDNRAVAASHSSEEAYSFVVLGTNELEVLPLTGNGAACEPRDVLVLTLKATVPPSGLGVGSLEFIDGVNVAGGAIDNVMSFQEGENAPTAARPQLERRSFTVGSPPCPPDPVRCGGLTVTGPANGGPGIYTVVMTTTGGGGSSRHEFSARNTAARLVSRKGLREDNVVTFGLTEGQWTITGAVTDGPECDSSVCDEVTVNVQCVEEPDSVSISGLTEAQVGSVVEVVATFQGLDPGAVVNGYSWEIAAGEGELVGADGPVARVRSTVPGEVSVRVIAGDSLCQDVSVASHQIDFKEPCPANLQADCQAIIVTGPEDNGPGEYLVRIAATFPTGFTPLYVYRAENPATGDRAVTDPLPINGARIPLYPGTWIFSAAVGVEPECPFDACSPVEVIVSCLEEPDSVSIVGADEAQADEVVELTASFSGIDAGGSISHEWEIVSGGGEIVGANDKSTVDVRAVTAGEVTVRVKSGDGVCEDEAEVLHTILFQDCLPPGSISCGGVDVEGPPGNVPGEYRFTVAATVPANQTALYFYRIENLQTGQSGTAGPGPFDEATAPLSVGTWEIRVSVGTDVNCPFVSCAPVRVDVAETQAGDIGPFVRGDCNADRTLNVTDAMCILDWLLGDGANPGCVASTNVNGDGNVDTSDAIYLLLFGFVGGAPPVAPFPSCGQSATAVDQAIGCESSPSYCQ